MPSYREIVTKTVVGKGKKRFTNHYTMVPEDLPTTILGCWVINHKFEGHHELGKIRVQGSCDVNIWYSYDNDTKTKVTKQTITYNELLAISKKRESDSLKDEIIIRCLSNPTCTKAEINGGIIEYDIDKELGIELVGDTKVKVAVDDEEDEWDEIIDEKEEENVMNDIEKEVNENFIDEKNKE